MSLLQKALESGAFAVTAEMAPPKGMDFSGVLETAKLLDGKGTYLVVTAADGGIVTNAVNGTASIALKDGETLALEYGTAAHPAARRGWVAVTGGGTLTVTLNGETFGTYTAADGAKEFVVPTTGQAAFGFRFAFDGEGSADLYGFSARLGSVFTLR